MKNLFKDFKLSAFGILFTILILVVGATWFVPAGEYVYKCDNGLVFTYKDSNDKEVAVCAISQEEHDKLTLLQANGGDEVVKNIENTIQQALVRIQPEYTYQETDPKRQGIWNIIESPVTGFTKAIDIIAFVFVIGGFINIVISSGAMDAGIYSLLNKFKGRELMLIPILMTLFALGGTSFGMAEETIVFYVILIPILFKAGFDNAVGMMIIGLGAGVGVLASSVNPFAIGVASTATGISPGMGLVGRLILFVIVLLIAIAFVYNYARKVKNDPTKSVTYDQRSMLEKAFAGDENEEIKMTGAHKIILMLFVLTFVLMILSVIPWVSAFNIELFEGFTQSLNQNFILLGGDNGILAFGHWYFTEMSGLFLAASFIIGMVAKGSGLIKGGIVSIFIDGCKDMMSVALIIGLSRGIQTILENSGMAPTLLYYGSNILSGLSTTVFSVLTYILYLPLSFLVPSTSGLATATMPIVGDLAQNVFGSDDGKVQAITAFSTASGLVNLITPTSGVIMGALSISKMEFGRWIKLIMPLIIVLFIVTVAFLWLTTQFGFYL